MDASGPPKLFRHDFGREDATGPEPLRTVNDPPPWRSFGTKEERDNAYPQRDMPEDERRRGASYVVREEIARMVDVSLVLRRPLMVTGPAGVGKSSLAYAIAWQLGLGRVLRWPITSRSTLKQALYQYDAVGRLQESSRRHQEGRNSEGDDPGIGDYVTLGPLGAALVPNRKGPFFPRLLLIDELDKGDIDLPNDLLHIFEVGSYEIPEVGRVRQSVQMPGGMIRVRIVGTADTAEIPADGVVRCDDFPMVVITTNGEREFSPAFRRRCLSVNMPTPSGPELERIVRNQLGLAGTFDDRGVSLLDKFREEYQKDGTGLAVEQLINAIYLARSAVDVDPGRHDEIKKAIFRSLNESRAE